MAVTTYRFGMDLPDGELSGGIDANGRSYTVSFYCETNNVLDDASVVIRFLANLGMVLGAPYNFSKWNGAIDLGARLESILPVTRRDFIPGGGEYPDGHVWTATLNFTSNPIDYDFFRGPPVDWRGYNPLFNKLIYNFTFENYEEDAERAYKVEEIASSDPTQPPQFKISKELAAILNSAYDPFDPPPIRTRNRPVLEIVRNELAPFQPALARKYVNKLNKTPFFGASMLKAKCLDIFPGDLRYHANCGDYYSVTYRFGFEDKTWVTKILDAGYRELGGNSLDCDSRTKAVIKDDNQMDINNPWPLDGFGKALPKCSDQYVFLKYVMDEAVDFGELGLER